MMNDFKRVRTILRIALVAAIVFQQTAALACTAFLAYDGKLALGGNSEDWEDPDRYFIWLLLDHGRHGVPCGVPPIQSFRSPQKSVERLLAKVHPILMLPLGSTDPRAAWLDKKRTVSYGGAPVHTVLPRHVDCLFFIETANELGQRRGEAPRAPEDELPKAEQILDTYVRVTGGKAAYASLRNRIEETTIEFVDSGMTFSMIAFYARPDQAYFLIEGETIGKMEKGTDGDVAWESSPTAGPVIKKGAERADMLRSAAFDRITQWRRLFEKAECVGIESIDGKPCFKVVLTPEIGDPETHYYNRKSSLISNMISRLELSHFAIIPTDSQKEGKRASNVGAPGGETGIDARVIESKALVTSVAEGSAAERVGVRPGWEIIRINDFDVVARLKALDRELPDTPSKRVKMAGEMVVRVRSGVGESVSVTFRNGEGDLADLTIPFGEPRGRSAKVGNFGYARVRIDVKTLGNNIGYIAVNKFLDPTYVMKTFNDALESFMDADGIILDLRGNGGGKDAMALGMMAWLAPSEWMAGRLRTRGNEIKMTVRPRARAYDGPVAVLTDGLTGSSAEFVAAALQEMGRACVIGTRTKGEALPAEYTTLPNGDVFLYAVADFVTGAGKRLEGVGVAPDIEVALTQGSLLEGRDIVLEAAVNWIRTQD